MVKIFSTDQVRELDQYTIQNEPISSIDLVERASDRFVREFVRHFSKQMRVIVFAGRGNNGADALAIARLLAEESFHVKAYLFNPSGVLSAECKENRDILKVMNTVDFTEVTTDFDAPALTTRDIVIDGLFGSGLTRPLEGGFAAIVDYINQSPAQIVSIDIPSGLFGEDNSRNNPEAIVCANMTFTFGFPKLAFLLADNARYVGEWKVLDIGFHPVAVEETETNFNLLTENDIAELLKPRDKFSHKGDYGHALLIAGSQGKMGAAQLAAYSCLRSGVGLLTVHIPQRCEMAMQITLPEAMLSLDQHHNHFFTVPKVNDYAAVGIGPGLGQHLETGLAFEKVIQIAKRPLLIDADALNLLSINDDLYRFIPADSILTPHPKEFDRLAGDSRSSYERLQKAQTYAVEKKLIVVLKGAYTTICTPSGNVFFNSTGNPGMATAGSGDVLTGIILALLAQGYEPENAAKLGVYLHGLSGDLAAQNRSEESMIAGDITEMLGKAFKQLK